MWFTTSRPSALIPQRDDVQQQRITLRIVFLRLADQERRTAGETQDHARYVPIQIFQARLLIIMWRAVEVRNRQKVSKKNNGFEFGERMSWPPFADASAAPGADLATLSLVVLRMSRNQPSTIEIGEPWSVYVVGGRRT